MITPSPLINRQEYVLGFLFSEPFAGEHSEVVLIRKLKPDWMAGCLNGVGGKIEPGEEPLEAMCREYHEEAGVKTEPLLWRKVGKMFVKEATIHIFTAFDQDAFRCSRSETEELIVKIPVKEVSFDKRMLSLEWLIPLCQSAIQFPFNTGVSWTPLDIQPGL